MCLKALPWVLETDIGTVHLMYPIPDPKKAPKEEDILGFQEPTILEGFEAGDPQNWLEGETIEPFESTLQPSERWLEQDFIPFDKEDSSSSSSSDDSVEIFGF